ncbi:hypothetical protein HY631_04525 [Candidatus Uhrbacteria bacterium]|nr:hypothetical protein [Candidatus Uhrbacteria bacterium]
MTTGCDRAWRRGRSPCDLDVAGWLVRLGAVAPLLLVLPGCPGSAAPIAYLQAAIEAAALFAVTVPVGFLLLVVAGEAGKLLDHVVERYRAFPPGLRALLRRVGLCVLVAAVHEAWTRWAPSAGVDPIIVTLGGLGLLVLLARWIVTGAADGLNAAQAWLTREVEAWAARAFSPPRGTPEREERGVSTPATSSAPRPATRQAAPSATPPTAPPTPRLAPHWAARSPARAERRASTPTARAAAPPATHSAAPLVVSRERVEAGPTCWTCGGPNDGHRH